jgi:hypothetical protein
LILSVQFYTDELKSALLGSKRRDRAMAALKRAPHGGRAVEEAFPSGSIDLNCARCKNRMDLVATIHPFCDQPGLTAHICPKCGHADSFLTAGKQLGS